MKRRELLQSLRAYVPYHPSESGYKGRFLSFIEAHRDCFERSLAPGHLTGSAWVLDRSGEYALLLHHRKLNRWLQPGGHADGEPNLWSVAQREAEEESGLSTLKPLGKGIFDIDIHRIPARKDEAAHWHYDVRFLFSADREEPLQGNEESKGLEWVRLEEITERVEHEPSITRMMEKSLPLKKTIKDGNHLT